MTTDPTRENYLKGSLTVKIVIDQRQVGILQADDIVDCYFIEDIFSSCLRGKITFYDAFGLLEHGPFIGEEMITLVYGLEEEREVAFHIWKVNRIIQAAETQATTESIIECYFVDTSFYHMTVPKYSRSYESGKKATDVVEHILKKMVGWESRQINIEDSKTTLENPIALPYWNCVESINWLLSYAEGSISRSSGYLCFANTNKTWSINVYTLNWLMSNNNDLDTTDYVFESPEEETRFNKIYEWWIEGIDKSKMNVVRGSKFRGYNSSSKKLLTHEFDFTDGIEKTTILGRKALVSDISDVNSSMNLADPSLKDLKNKVYDLWVKQYSKLNLVNVIVPGNEKRYAGMQIRIRWPSNNPDQQRYQKQLEGKYLIKSITHQFHGKNRGSRNYMQKLVLIKNGYQDSASRSLYDAVKTSLTGGKRKKTELLST